MKIEKILDKKSGIYCLVNLINGKKYIGSSKNLYNRLHGHFCNLKYKKHHSIHLQNSYNKYGKLSFSYFILEFCKINELEDKEQYYLDLYKPIYNKRIDATRNIGLPISKETKTKISETLKRKYKENIIKTYRQDHLWVYSFAYNIDTFKLEFESKNLKEMESFIKRKSLGRRSFNTIINNKYALLNKKIDNINQLKNYIYKYLYKKNNFYILSIKNNTIVYYKSIKDCAIKNNINVCTLTTNLLKNKFYCINNILIKKQALYKPI